MAAGSLLRRKTLVLMTASSKESQFLRVWVFNCLCVRVFLFPRAQYVVALSYLGLFLPGPPQIIIYLSAVCSFVVKWRQNMLFLTNELAKKAEITSLRHRKLRGLGSRPVHHG